MAHETPNFSIHVDGVTGVCPAAERWAEDKLVNRRIPVLACESACIRGDIARLAANIIAAEPPFARMCYAETAFVPHSAMARWVKEAEQVIMINGCFLQCFGRVLNNLVDRAKITHIDALSLYNKYTDVFYMEDVPQAERYETARGVAEKILRRLRSAVAAGQDAILLYETSVCEPEAGLDEECTGDCEED
ncbi:MAG TPA: putative zinc-binding protein [Dehalococcoidia bacterium]|nr:putative zinc-binding protein [Dehalococcoidia bacterium]